MQNGGQQNNPSLRVNAKKISEHLTAKLPVQKTLRQYRIWSEKKMARSTRGGLARRDDWELT